jgi:hypothetical protein
MVTTVPCGSCGTQLRLGRELVLKLAGRTGKLTCKSCGARLRLDGRGPSLLVSLEPATSAAALLSRPIQTRAEIAFAESDLESVRPPDGANGESAENAKDEPVMDAAPLLVVPPPLPSEVTAPVPSIEELAKQSRRALPKRLSLPPPRDTTETLSPVVQSDEFEEPLPSSPEAERRLELRALYSDFELPPPPAQTTVTSRAPRPPQRSRGPISAGSILPPTFGASGPANVSAPPSTLTSSEMSSNAPVAFSTPPVREEKRGANYFALAAAALLGAAIASPEARALAFGVANPGGGVAAHSMAKSTFDVHVPALEKSVTLPSLAPALVREVPETLIEGPLPPVTPVVSSKPVAKSSSELKELPVGVPSSESQNSESDAKSTEPSASAEETNLPPFDEVRASMALKAVTSEAGSCRGETDPTGQTKVVVTFAPSGRVTTATISGPPFAGTPTGSCIAAKFRSIRVEPFAGDRVTMTRDVVIY